MSEARYRGHLLQCDFSMWLVQIGCLAADAGLPPRAQQVVLHGLDALRGVLGTPGDTVLLVEESQGLPVSNEVLRDTHMRAGILACEVLEVVIRAVPRVRVDRALLMVEVGN